LVETFCKKLDLGWTIIKDVQEIASKSIELLEGKKPASVAAAAILYVMKRDDLKERRGEIATIAGISPNTLRNVFTELKNAGDLPGGNYYQVD